LIDPRNRKGHNTTIILKERCRRWVVKVRQVLQILLERRERKGGVEGCGDEKDILFQESSRLEGGEIGRRGENDRPSTLDTVVEVGNG